MTEINGGYWDRPEALNPLSPRWDHDFVLKPDDVDAFVGQAFPGLASEFCCDEIGNDHATARWHFNEQKLRPGKLISGPTQFATADLALWFVSFTVLGLEPMAVTSDMQITFLRPACGGDLLARAELLRAGRTRISGRVLLWIDGEPDKPVAHATGNYALLRAPTE